MQRIHNTTTGKTVWRGTDYRVDGQPASVDPPLYLLDDVTRQAPDYDAATHRLQSIPAHADLETGEWVLSSYEVVALTEEEIAAREADAARKVWPTVTQFWDEFSDAEQYGIEVSTDPEIIVLRAKLKLWLSDVWSDDPRIVYALSKLVTIGILTEERRAAILQKA
jgi:hypothetical protein